MHASFDQLLTLRDGRPAEAALAEHVRNCSECTLQLDQLQRRTDDLRRLPQRWTAPQRWEEISAAHSRPAIAAAPVRGRPGWWLPAASAAALVMALVLTLQQRTPIESETKPEIVPVAAETNAWMQESQRLEQLLATFPSEPRITRASTAFTVADLEDRIQWVDYRLNLVAEAGLGEEQSQRLWRERAELMNSLVAVRYAETRAAAF